MAFCVHVGFHLSRHRRGHPHGKWPSLIYGYDFFSLNNKILSVIAIRERAQSKIPSQHIMELTKKLISLYENAVE